MADQCLAFVDTSRAQGIVPTAANMRPVRIACTTTGKRVQSAINNETRRFFRVFASVIVGKFVCWYFPLRVYSARAEESDASTGGLMTVFVKRITALMRGSPAER